MAADEVGGFRGLIRSVDFLAARDGAEQAAHDSGGIGVFFVRTLVLKVYPPFSTLVTYAIRLYFQHE